MGNFFDFNGDGKVDAFEFLMATAADPNNPFNQPPEGDDDEEEESITDTDEIDDNDEDDDCFTEDDDYDL